jgi:hypothetical protein
MGISFVGAGGNFTNVASGTGLPVTCPTGVVDGDVMLAGWACATSAASAPTITTPPSGWTQLGATQSFGATGTLAASALYMKIASGETAGTTTYSLTWSGGRIAGSIAAFRGVVNTSVAAAQDATVTVNNTGTTSATSINFPAITSVTPGAWRIGYGGAEVVATSTTGQTWLPPAGWTEALNSDQTSTTPTAVKQAVSVIDYFVTTTIGVQAAAAATISSASQAAMYSVLLVPKPPIRHVGKFAY